MKTRIKIGTKIEIKTNICGIERIEILECKEVDEERNEYKFKNLTRYKRNLTTADRYWFESTSRKIRVI